MRLWVSQLASPKGGLLSNLRTQHPNAPLTPEGRRRVGAYVVDHGWSVGATADRFQVDAKTVRKCRCVGYRYSHIALDDRTRLAHSEILDDAQAVTVAEFWIAERGLGTRRRRAPLRPVYVELRFSRRLSHSQAPTTTADTERYDVSAILVPGDSLAARSPSYGRITAELRASRALVSDSPRLDPSIRPP